MSSGSEIREKDLTRIVTQSGAINRVPSFPLVSLCAIRARFMLGLLGYRFFRQRVLAISAPVSRFPRSRLGWTNDDDAARDVPELRIGDGYFDSKTHRDPGEKEGDGGEISS